MPEIRENRQLNKSILLPIVRTGSNESRKALSFHQHHPSPSYCPTEDLGGPGHHPSSGLHQGNGDRISVTSSRSGKGGGGGCGGGSDKLPDSCFGWWHPKRWVRRGPRACCTTTCCTAASNTSSRFALTITFSW